MKLGVVLACALTAGCGFSSPKAGEQPDGVAVAMMEAAVVATTAAGGTPDACVTFSSQLDTCRLSGLSPLTLAGTLTFDTDAGTLKDSGGATIAVTTMPFSTLGGDVRAIARPPSCFSRTPTLSAVGSRGLAIIATDRITLEMGASIDVSAGGAGRRGNCGATGAAAGADDSGGGAGGGGGGFGEAGGKGGNGNSDGGQSNGGRAGAAASAPAGPTGGCPGAAGGKGSGSNDGGAGGAGGGAVYLVAGSSIALGMMAGINAGGGGGGGGERESGFGDAGGGGGGSGGSIFLEAPMIQARARWPRTAAAVARAPAIMPPAPRGRPVG